MSWYRKWLGLKRNLLAMIVLIGQGTENGSKYDIPAVTDPPGELI